MKDSSRTRVAARHPLGKWIDRHTTPVDFAREIGCSRAHLYNIIAGRKRPSVDLLERIAKKTNGRIGLSAFKTLEAAE